MTTNNELDSLVYPWAYRPVNNGFEIVYIKDGCYHYFLEGDSDNGVHTNETIVKYIVDSHNKNITSIE